MNVAIKWIYIAAFLTGVVPLERWDRERPNGTIPVKKGKEQVHFTATFMKKKNSFILTTDLYIQI